MKLSLGTAQFGLNYGISNKKGLIKKNEVTKILDYCIKNNIRNIDTAKSYGNAEKILGQYKNIKKFRINSKISNLVNIKNISTIKNQIEDSLKKLKISKLNVCYIHNFNDIKIKENGIKIFTELNKLKKNNKIKKIGISIYTLKELNFCLKYYIFDTVQIPMNILNQDFCSMKIFQNLKKKKITIEVRSIFLQGIFFLNPHKLHKKFKPLKSKLLKLKKIRHEKNDMLKHCIKFVKSFKMVKKIIIGVTSVKELKTILKYYNLRNYKPINYSLYKSKSKMRNPIFW